MKDILLTREELQEIVEYRSNGMLIWKAHRCRAQKGERAGFSHDHGFSVTLFGAVYRTDRLVWIIHHGRDAGRLKHVNGNLHDDRIENLEAIPFKRKAKRVKKDPIEIPVSTDPYWKHLQYANAAANGRVDPRYVAPIVPHEPGTISVEMIPTKGFKF